MRRLRFRLAVLCLAASASGAGCVAPPDDLETKSGAAVDVCATAPEGALCDDKNVCTIFDVCKAGVCKGSAAPNGTLCTDGNVCTANDSCRAGLCAGDAVPDLTACTDGDPCTVGDACKTGVCLSGAGMLACSDGIACTLDVCVAGVGCVFQPAGDCTVPKDGGPDASDAKADAAKDVVADATPDVSSTPDAMMSGGDAASDKDDAPVQDASVVDVMTVDAMSLDATSGDATSGDAMTGDAMTSGDATSGDVATPVDAAGDRLFDAGAEAGGAADAATDGVEASDAGAEPDAAVDAAEDAGDAADAAPDVAVDERSPVPTLPDLRATGGACNCAASPGAGGPAWVVIALGLVLASRRRRR